MPSADASLVGWILDRSLRSVLMLSNDQLSEREAAFDLIKRATLTIFNDVEAAQLTGEIDPLAAALVLRERGARSLLITSERLVTGWSGSGYFERPCFETGSATGTSPRTIGAGDVFTGTVVASLMQNLSLEAAAVNGIAACADHVERRRPVRSLKALAERTRQRNGQLRREDIESAVTRSARRSLTRWGLAAAVLAGVAVLSVQQFV